MHVLQHLYDLRHHHYLLHDLLQHHRDLDDPVLGDYHWVSFSLHDLGHCFEGFFDEADLGLQDLLLLSDELLLHLHVDRLERGAGLFGARDVALMHLLDNLDLLQQVRHLHQPFHYPLDVLVDVDDLGHDPLHDLDRRRREDYLWLLFVLVDLWDFLDGRHQFLYVVRDFSNLVDVGVNCYDFLLESLDFLDLSLDVRLRDFLELVSLLNVHPLFNLRYNLRLPLHD